MTTTYTVRSNISWGALPVDTMDAYLPRSAAKPTGAIIMIHGGDWAAEDKSLFELGGTSRGGKFQQNFASAFAAAGIAVFSIDYTLGNGTTIKWPQVYASVEAAVSYIRENAAAYNVDPNAIGALGGSSGGELASMLGVTGQVAFVVDNSGPVDLLNAPKLKGIVDRMIGYSPVKEEAASPIDNIGANAASFFISQGISDPFVTAQSQGQAFNQALHADGVSSTLREYAGGHVFTGATAAADWSVLDQEVSWTASQIGRLQTLAHHMAAMNTPGLSYDLSSPGFGESPTAIFAHPTRVLG